MWYQAHPFFAGMEWGRLYSQTPPYTPTVTHELDTRNFENFEVQLNIRGLIGTGP